MKSRKTTVRAADLVWDDLRVMAVAARVGSLSAAAQRLGVSVATVGRRLERLEAALGVRLFQRHSAGLSPTAAAEGILAQAEGVSEAIDAIARTASAQVGNPSGVVTLSTLEIIVTRVLAPRLGALRKRYPRIDLILRSTPRIVRLDRRVADLAIRVVRPNEPQVIGRKLGVSPQCLYAAPAYLDAFGRPPPQDLRGHAVVAFDTVWDPMPEMAWLLERLGGEAPAFRVTTVAAMSAVVRSGAAVGVLPTFVASSSLVPLEEVLPPRELWLVMHEDLRHAPSVQAVANFVGEVFAEVLEVGR